MTSYGRMLHMSKGSGMHPPNVRWKLPQRHVSVSYGQFSLNRDCIAHWLHVHFAPLLLQNPSIIFFLSLVIVGPINSLQCGTMHVKVLFMSGSPIQNRLSFLDYNWSEEIWYPDRSGQRQNVWPFTVDTYDQREEKLNKAQSINRYEGIVSLTLFSIVLSIWWLYTGSRASDITIT